MYFYRDKQGNVVCEVCANRATLKPFNLEGGSLNEDGLRLINVIQLYQDFTCAQCYEKFVVHDARVYREV